MTRKKEEEPQRKQSKFAELIYLLSLEAKKYFVGLTRSELQTLYKGKELRVGIGSPGKPRTEKVMIEDVMVFQKLTNVEVVFRWVLSDLGLNDKWGFTTLLIPKVPENTDLDTYKVPFSALDFRNELSISVFEKIRREESNFLKQKNWGDFIERK